MKDSIGRRARARTISAAAGWLMLAVAGSLAVGCVEPSTAEQPEPPAPGALRGELVLYTLTFDDGTSDEQYFLRVGGDERDERRLYFDTDPGPGPGRPGRRLGRTPSGEGLEVARIEPVRSKPRRHRRALAAR